jgi:hypothetical protein
MTTGPKHLFIFGIARGGTNLVARMLRQHSLVTVGLDATLPVLNAWRTEILFRTSYRGGPQSHVPAHPDYYFSRRAHESLSSVLNWHEDVLFPQNLQKDVKSAVESRAGLENQLPRGAFEQVDASSARRAVDSVMRATVGSGMPVWLGTKEVWAVDMIPTLAANFPDARFIVINRDPRAIINSLIKLSEVDPTQWAHVPSYLRHWRKQVAILHEIIVMRTDLRDRLMVVRYEDLLEQPGPKARQMVGHLGIPWEEAVLHPDGDQLWLGNSSGGPLKGTIDPLRAAGWQSTLETNCQHFVEALVKPEMGLAGYQASFQDPGAVASLVAEQLRLYDSNPGRWRSDSGNMAHETQSEIERISVFNSEDSSISPLRASELFLFSTVPAYARSALGSQ